MNTLKSNFKLGVLGGGQLGRMLIQEAINLNINTYILDPDENAPCKDIATGFTQGSFKDYDAVYNFGKEMDLVTIEIEHVNVEALKKLRDEGVDVYPQPEVIELVQDKGSQKEFYKKNNIPTAPFHLIKDKSEIMDYVDEFPFFQKLRKGGYDGKGVQKLSKPEKLDKAFDAPSVLEKKVNFEMELSVVVARNAKGEVVAFPPVELDFNPKANLVEYLFAPARINGLVAAEATEIAKTVASKLKIVGLLAVELFLTKKGKVLVNEIAPRPHNSGHQTIEANYTSQYMQHLRAILNLPLGSTKPKTASVMVNLLGEPDYDGIAKYEGLEKAIGIEGVNVHLYGKLYTRPFRKMGHVTIIADSLDKAIEKAKIVKETLKVKA